MYDENTKSIYLSNESTLDEWAGAETCEKKKLAKKYFMRGEERVTPLKVRIPKLIHFRSPDSWGDFSPGGGVFFAF